MSMFVINIIADGKEDGSYDVLALNKFPIVYFSDSIESLFTEDAFISAVKQLMKSEKVYSSSKMCIREFSEKVMKNEFIIDTKEKIKIDF